MKKSLLVGLLCLGAPSGAVAQAAGVYEVRLDLPEQKYSDFVGILVLAPRSFGPKSAPEGFRSVSFQPNACFRFQNRPDRIDGREFYPGIVEFGLTRWSEIADSLHVPVYRSPDASAALVGGWSDDGFAGHVWQSDWDGRNRGPWISFSAERVGEWREDACTELVRDAGSGGSAGRR